MTVTQWIGKVEVLALSNSVETVPFNERTWPLPHPEPDPHPRDFSVLGVVDKAQLAVEAGLQDR